MTTRTEIRVFTNFPLAKGKNRSNVGTIISVEQKVAAEAAEAEQLAMMGAGAGVWSASKTAGAHKLILVAPDQASKDLWMKKLRRGIEASLLSKYVNEVKYTDMGDPYLVERLYGADDTAEALGKQMDILLKAITKSPDNMDLLKQMTELSQVQAEWVVGAKDTFNDFAEDEVEKTIITPEGCDIYVKFEEAGSLGILFEGWDGNDTHITRIVPGSKASKMGTLVQGLQLTHVQRNDIRHCTDIDEVLTLVVNSARPLLLKFVRQAVVTCKFQEVSTRAICRGSWLIDLLCQTACACRSRPPG